MSAAARGPPERSRRPMAYSREIRGSILTINASMVEIDRKFVGVISDAGIRISNSASTASIRLIISIELSPASLS
jgi:hypothetical protein